LWVGTLCLHWAPLVLLVLEIVEQRRLVRAQIAEEEPCADSTLSDSK
jgi:hypothetical protein